MENAGLVLSKKRQFITVLLSFVILGACFKVMVLVPGFTEVRPVNAVPVPAGLLFGPVGALACAVGNLIADVMGTLTLSSSLGFIGNFTAAYLPYKLWHLYYDEDPNVHSLRKIFIFGWISFVASIAVAWMIGTLIWLIFGLKIENMALYIFLNDFIFPLIFGLPVFIVLTCESVRIKCIARPKDILPIPPRIRKILVVVYTILIIPVLFMTHTMNDAYFIPSAVLSVPIFIISAVLML